jgi:hypothetical protein
MQCPSTEIPPVCPSPEAAQQIAIEVIRLIDPGAGLAQMHGDVPERVAAHEHKQRTE